MQSLHLHYHHDHDHLYHDHNSFKMNDRKEGQNGHFSIVRMSIKYNPDV